MKDKLNAWIYKVDNWLLQRKLWKAADVLMSCGHGNGSVQGEISRAKDHIYQAIHIAKTRYKCD